MISVKVDRPNLLFSLKIWPDQVLHFSPLSALGVVGVQQSQIKACVRYFSVFLKDKCISSLFRTKYIEKKFNLQLFFLPTVSRTFILSWATTRYPPPWNFLFRKNNCMYNRDNAHDVTTCPDEQSTKRSEPNKPSTNFVKGLQTSWKVFKLLLHT